MRIERDHYYVETEVAECLGLKVRTLQQYRREDVDAGTPGQRTPTPVAITARRYVYRGGDVIDWLEHRRSSSAQPVTTLAAKAEAG